MLIKDDKYQNLGTRDRYFVKVINENPDLFMNITITEFAKQVKTSASTISKFIRRLNFENYREFQNYLTREKIAHDAMTLVSLDKKALIIGNNNFEFKNYDHYFLSKTINHLDYPGFIKLVNQIDKAKKIWIIGRDTNHLAALDLTNSLIHLGKIAFATNDIKELDLQLNYLDSNDLVIFITENWKKTKYYPTIKNLKDNQVKTATITGLNSLPTAPTDFVVTFYSPSNTKECLQFYNAKIQELFINNLLIQALTKKLD